MAKYSKTEIYNALIEAQQDGRGLNETARKLGMSRSGLYNYCQQFQIYLRRVDMRVEPTPEYVEQQTKMAINYLYNQGYIIKRRTGTDLAHFLSTRALRAVKSG